MDNVCLAKEIRDKGHLENGHKAECLDFNMIQGAKGTASVGTDTCSGTHSLGAGLEKDH